MKYTVKQTAAAVLSNAARRKELSCVTICRGMEKTHRAAAAGVRHGVQSKRLYGDLGESYGQEYIIGCANKQQVLVT